MMILNINLHKYLNNLTTSDTVIVAVSGGVDSTVLLDLVLKAGYKVVIAHVNHHKRIESIDQEKYLLLSYENGIYVNLYDLIIKTETSEYTIPTNSFM